jgi:hypothetical protein
MNRTRRLGRLGGVGRGRGRGRPFAWLWVLGANLSDAIWWTLIVLALWALPVGMLGAAAGSARPRRPNAREHAGPVSSP